MTDVTLTDTVSYKRLVAVGNKEFWYEDDMTAGEMVELTAANGSIDTTDQLQMFELHQKIFVVNGENLKVADFINTKLTHAVLTTPHAHGDILTQAESDAVMIVDYTDTTKENTYGYVISEAPFVLTGGSHEVTGDGSGLAFTPTYVRDTTRLTHPVLTTAHTLGDVLTQEVSGASMVVDITDATKENTYGIATGTFVLPTDYEVTGDGDGSAFTPTAVSILRVKLTHPVLTTPYSTGVMLKQYVTTNPLVISYITVDFTDGSKTHTYGSYSGILPVAGTLVQKTLGTGDTSFTPTVVTAEQMLTHSALGTAHTNGDILTQEVSNATMIVDTTNTGKTHTYGTDITGIFVLPTAYRIIGNGSGTTFTPTVITEETRLAHTALGTAHAQGDTLTQAVTGATMVVDITNTAKTYTYGIAAGDFDSTGDHEVTGSGDGTAFIPTVITERPHWYNWTVYAGDEDTYGIMPDRVYLGCAYRGRAMLSGNPDNPGQWYMSRQNNPWDFQYIAADAQAPIAGGDFEAGKLGDIVRALIPFRNDFVILGCVNSTMIIIGDPAEGGTPNAYDQTTGIFGANSWCFDGGGNLWFWGSNGLYMATMPDAPICISLQSLPNLVKDEAATSSTHRITLGYDRKRNGILIAITKISDGTNSNYFYDLSTQGFFPEEYPGECGIYSQYFYASNAEANRDLLVGCKDGYIRRFDENEENDNGEAIESYVAFGALPLFDGEYEGVISSLDVITGGGQTGDNADSNNIGYKIWASPSAEETLEKLDNDSIPNLAGTILATGVRGRGSRDPRKVRGVFATIKLYNNTLDQTWSFEKLNIHVEED